MVIISNFHYCVYMFLRGEFKTNYCNIYPKELQLHKENTDKHEGSFSDLDIKIRETFQEGLFNKRDLFPFSIVRNTKQVKQYSVIGAEYFRIAKASKTLT